MYYKNKKMIPVSTSFFESFKPSKEEQPKPYFKFKGSKIPYSLWQAIVSFFLEHAKAEVQVRLYYHESNNTWHAIVFPQYYPTGLTTKEIADHDMKQKICQEHLCDKMVYFGSVHHHCNISAFQSGTDHADEIGVNGLHITLGNLDKDVLDIHGRVCFAGIFYECNWSSWFDLPSWLSPDAPSSFQNEAIKSILTQPITHSYPAYWKDCLIENKTFNPFPNQKKSKDWKNPDKDLDINTFDELDELDEFDNYDELDDEYLMAIHASHKMKFFYEDGTYEEYLVTKIDQYNTPSIIHPFSEKEYEQYGIHRDIFLDLGPEVYNDINDLITCRKEFGIVDISLTEI